MLFKTKIRVNTKAKSAPSVRKTIFEYEESAAGRGTEDFTALAAEFLERFEMVIRGGIPTEGTASQEAVNG